MGAGAFVMVELTGVPYTGIMAAAFLPSLLYFLAVWVGINAYATKFDLRPVAKDDQPPRARRCRHRRLLHGAVRGAALGHVRLRRHAAIRRLHGDPGGGGDAVPGRDACGSTGRRTLLRIENALITAGRQVSMIAAIIPVRLAYHRRAVDHRTGGENHVADPFPDPAACCGRRCC